MPSVVEATSILADLVEIVAVWCFDPMVEIGWHSATGCLAAECEDFEPPSARQTRGPWL